LAALAAKQSHQRTHGGADRPGCRLLDVHPALGSVGLWDPWETHYGEVAREMIVRGDYVYPYWESSYFFSKPALPLWLIALGLWITGSENPNLPEAPMGPLTEWGMRIPFALIAIATMWAVYRIGRQLKDRNTGLLAALVLATSCQFIFIGKQAMVDMPFVGLMTIGLALFIGAVFDREADGCRHPGYGWWPRSASRSRSFLS